MVRPDTTIITVIITTNINVIIFIDVICTHCGLVGRNLAQTVSPLVVLQPELTLAVEGHKEGDVMGLTVFPGGGYSPVPQDPGHGEVKARVADEEEGPVGRAPHQSEEALANCCPLSMGHLREGSPTQPVYSIQNTEYIMQ